MPIKKQASSQQHSDLAPYREQDAEQFAVLNDTIKRGQFDSRHSNKKAGKLPHHRCSYSESDGAQFQKILPRVDTAERQEAPLGDARTNNGIGSAYKQSDNDQFQALMDFNGNPPRDHDAKPALFNNDERSFSYSEQDLQTFNQLIDGGQANQTNTSGAFSHKPSRSEQAVGHIKIVAFDGNKNKARKAARQGNLNIKVRYFD